MEAHRLRGTTSSLTATATPDFHAQTDDHVVHGGAVGHVVGSAVHAYEHPNRSRRERRDELRARAGGQELGDGVSRHRGQQDAVAVVAGGDEARRWPLRR